VKLWSIESILNTQAILLDVNAAPHLKEYERRRRHTSQPELEKVDAEHDQRPGAEPIEAEADAERLVSQTLDVAVGANQ
jgi:hypothetical protein